MNGDVIVLFMRFQYFDKDSSPETFRCVIVWMEPEIVNKCKFSNENVSVWMLPLANLG